MVPHHYGLMQVVALPPYNLAHMGRNLSCSAIIQRVPGTYVAFQKKTFLLDPGLIVHYPYHRLCHELMMFRIDFLKLLLMMILVLKKA